MEDTPHPSRGVGKDIVQAIAYKSISSPFSRLQLILQNQTYLGQIGLLPEALRNIHSTQISLGVYIYKNEGFIALFRGHTVTVIQTIGNTLLDTYVKPYINDIFGIPSNSTNNNPNEPQSSPNPPDLPNDTITMERTRSLDDPSLAETEVPALLNMIHRHQSDASDTGDSSNNNNNNNHAIQSNSTKNVSFFQKCARLARKHIKHEIYPLLSLAVLYPLNVVQTMYWMDLRDAVNVISINNTSNKSIESSNTNGMEISTHRYAFDQGYFECYKSLGGSFDILYTGLLSAVIGTFVYRQTYFNLHRVIDTLLYKIIGKKPSEYNNINKKSRNSGLIMNRYGIASAIDKKREKDIEEQEKLFEIVNNALRGAITTNFAIFAHFPFQVIKYRMMLNNHPNAGVKYSGYKDCILQTFNNEGLKAFFYGATANLIMGVVASVALITIDITKVAIIEGRNKEMRQKQLQRYAAIRQ